MKKQLLLPVFAVAAGAAAFLLRLTQNQKGFETTTGLPVPGHPAGFALIGVLALTAVLLLVLSRPLKQQPALFPESFLTQEAAFLVLPVMGCLLMLASGALEAAAMLGAGPVAPEEPPVLQIVLAASGVLSGIALFPAVSRCRFHDLPEDTGEAEQADGRNDDLVCNLLLLPPACMVVRLVLVYRTHSVNPTLAAYYVELLALVFLTLAFFALASVPFRTASARRFAFHSGAAAALCVAVMADRITLAARLFYAGGALALLGFLLLYLCCPPQHGQ